MDERPAHQPPPNTDPGDVFAILVALAVAMLLASCGKSSSGEWSVGRVRSCALNCNGIGTAMAVWMTQNIDVPPDESAALTFDTEGVIVEATGSAVARRGPLALFFRPGSRAIIEIARDRKMFRCPGVQGENLAPDGQHYRWVHGYRWLKGRKEKLDFAYCLHHPDIHRSVLMQELDGPVREPVEPLDWLWMLGRDPSS